MEAFSLYILYLDESGDSNSWGVQENFVLGGIAINENQVYSLTRNLNELQEKYFPGRPTPINFHASKIKYGADEFNIFSYEERMEILNDVYDILLNARVYNMIAFAVCINKTSVISSYQVTDDCFNSICQNFNLYLYHSYKKRIIHKGMLIIDRGREQQYLEIYNRLKKSEHVQEYLRNVIDIPYFGASEHTRMLQLADFVANAVWRYYERGDTVNIDKIRHLFYRGDRQHPPARGLNHITQLEDCECYACS